MVRVDAELPPHGSLGPLFLAFGLITAEELRAGAGEWVLKHTGVAGIPLPGLYTQTPLPSGITGLTALNPALAALVSSNPGVAHMMTAGINGDEVPFERGWVKLRGVPAVVTKADIIGLFKASEAVIKRVLVSMRREGRRAGHVPVGCGRALHRLHGALLADVALRPPTARPRTAAR